MPVPASRCCRSSPAEPRPPDRFSSTALCCSRCRCCRGCWGLPAQSTARVSPSAARPSLRSRCSSTGARRSIDGLPIACSRFRFSTCSYCLRLCWPATARIDRRSPFPRAPLRPPSRRSMLLSASHAVPAKAKLRGSDMRYFPLAVLLIVAATLGGCSEGVLDPKGPVAAAERLIMLNATGIMLAIVTPTMIATLGVAYWYRASNARARYLPEFSYSGRLELLVWAIPIMTIILTGGVAWLSSYDLDPPKPLASAVKPVRVQVVSLDWKWLFIYPDEGVASVNHLTVPVGTPISFVLTSAGVMNSFFVPQLAGQIYTMAGL